MWKASARRGRSRPTGVVLILAVVWVLAVWYAEWLVPQRAFTHCYWPSKSDTATRIALVADPQLVDDNTYPGRNKMFLSATRYVVDRYLAKNWRLLNQVLDPDSFIFLGDLFDGGREWEDRAWQEEFARWNDIFEQPQGKRVCMGLAGNHDIGYGDTVVPHALDRFSAYFGPTNRVFQAGGFNMVLLDTLSLLNTNDPLIYGPPKHFLGNITANLAGGAPTILFTHVPLFRPKDATCGKYREGSETLPWQKGYQYITQITPELTDEVLRVVRPVAIFSGDDHDACHVVHRYDTPAGPREADEYTVKSFSMAMGISEPGLQLLTLDAVDGYKTSICLMSDPLWALKLYALLAVASLGAVWYSTRSKAPTPLPIAEKKGIKRSFSPRGWIITTNVGVLMVAFVIGQIAVSYKIYSGV